jgi:hypothetical protein
MLLLLLLWACGPVGAPDAGSQVACSSRLSRMAQHSFTTDGVLPTTLAACCGGGPVWQDVTCWVFGEFLLAVPAGSRGGGFPQVQWNIPGVHAAAAGVVLVIRSQDACMTSCCALSWSSMMLLEDVCSACHALAACLAQNELWGCHILCGAHAVQCRAWQSPPSFSNPVCCGCRCCALCAGGHTMPIKACVPTTEATKLGHPARCRGREGREGGGGRGGVDFGGTSLQHTASG